MTGLLKFSLPLLTVLFFLSSCGPPHITPGPHEKKRPSPAPQRPYSISGKTYYPVPSAEGYRETGIASWYGKKFHGRKTSNGERYDMYAETAAHKTLPMGTILVVRNLENNKKTVVRINDRGPFVKGRIIDLSHTAANKIGLIQNGTARVSITALGEAEPAQQKDTTTPIKLKHQDFQTGKFYIQVGAFEHLDNARNLARTFAGHGRDVVIQQYPAAGIQLYRVMVFSGTTLKRAKLYERDLENNGFPNALIIAR
jgi:rare lipoprotein A